LGIHTPDTRHEQYESQPDNGIYYGEMPECHIISPNAKKREERREEFGGIIGERILNLY
jgi:hypothetical protein